ncbi:MAG: hypothetical protein NT038_03555 [Euryarchaeota archaeon]|nr:hypothetical protein [Euryarchaeota archaeon]
MTGNTEHTKKLKLIEGQIKKREDDEAEQLTQQDMHEIDKKIDEKEQFTEYLDKIMDTNEDWQKFKIIPALSGIIKVDGEETFYHTVFAQKQGHYTPIVLTSQGRLYSVCNNASILVSSSQDPNDTKYKDEEGNPIYNEVKDVPLEERYQYFKIGAVTYKYIQPIFWNDDHSIHMVDNTAIHDVINKKEYTKQIFNDNKKIIQDYFYHPNEYEYDVLCTADIISYIKDVLGNVFYLCLYGGPSTGKSVVICLLSFLQYHGYFTGKGTIPSSCRLLHFYGISLNQDEFEKMRQDEKTVLVNIFNNGFNSYGRYTLSNMGVKDITKQALGLKTFGMKSFTCNDLGGFDTSFIDRLYTILSVKTNKKLKNIYRLSSDELKRFQDMRDKLFVYCLFHWKQIQDDIETTRDTLEAKDIFGRETDKNSIILGIIKHFMGEDYAKKVQAYIAVKAPVSQLEHVKTMEYVLLDTIIKKCDANKPAAFIDVSNEELYQKLLKELDCQEGDQYAPTNTKPRKILDSLGLTSRKENLGMEHGGKRTYHINTLELINTLKSNNYKELLPSTSWQESLTTLTPLTTLTKTGEGGEGNEGGEDTRLEQDKNSHLSNKNTIDQANDTRKLQEFISASKNKVVSKKAVISFIKCVLKKYNPDDYYSHLLQYGILTFYSGKGVMFTGGT